MSMDLIWYVLLIDVSVLASAFFAGMETGLISLNRLRLRHQVERKNRRAVVLNGFVENTDRLLGTTLFGTNLSHVVVAVSTSVLAERLFGRHHAVEQIATLTAAALLVILGEIVPKTLFRHYPYRLCILFADALAAMAWLFAPFVAVFGVLMRAISGAELTRSFFVTREELKSLAKEGEVEGALSSEEREMIHGVFDFPHKTVYDVMVPLARTVTVAPETAVTELYEISKRTGFARFPVRDADKLVGVVNVYELLFDAPAPANAPVKEFIRKSPVVFSTERIDRVLPRLRASRNPISIVVDPEGN